MYRDIALLCSLFALFLLSAGRFAFGLGEEFFRFDFVAFAVDGGNEVIFGEEVDKGGEIFVVHDDD